MHLPPTQFWPEPQTVPQPPQLSGSASVAMHLPAHDELPGAQPQAPLVQVCPPVHALPHLPQLLTSESVATQAPLHTD